MSIHRTSRVPWRRVRSLAALALAVCLSPLAAGQTQSWAHLQVSGVSNATFTVNVTIGSEVYVIENAPARTTASDLARDLAAEINSARHGHMLMAAVNGVDGSIVSIIADGSPTPSTTPWLGRLVPAPRISVEPGNSGIEIQRTDIDSTVLAVNVEGQESAAARAQLSTRINGQTFTVALNADAEQPQAVSARQLAENLSEMINRNPGFRSSLLEDDSGQLRLFITAENLGGGLHLDQPPRGVEGVTFDRSSVLFASQTLYAARD